MTGFGRGEFKDDNVQCIVEIKTVNHRYSDYTVKMPRELMTLEERIRNVLQQYIQRGKTDVYITYIDSSSSENDISVNEGVVSAYFNAMKNSSEILGYNFKPDVSMLFKIPDAFICFVDKKDAESVWEKLYPSLKEAAENLTEMREKEGEKLKCELISILKNTQGFFKNIRERSPFVPLEYKEKLSQRMAEIMDNAIIDEQRIAAEAAVFADKCSIDEEIARLDSHIKQFYDAIECGGSVGRRLDFIVQEMNREINTMGSKANDITITNNVIALKSEIEKLREQIQNLE